MSIYDILVENKIIDPEKVVKYADRVRDRDDICVYKDTESGVIFLKDMAGSLPDSYQVKNGLEYWQQSWNATEKERLLATDFISEDDIRRSQQFSTYLKGKRWLDFGCGLGGALRQYSSQCEVAQGLELQSTPRELLNEIGIKTYESIPELEDNYFDTITLFHVLEHISEPIDLLKSLSSKLVNNGSLIIEVPHAKDALLETYKSEHFKAFTLWSEHLVLHTRESLRKIITAAGLKPVSIQGFQRYPLSNHLYWLSQGKPGGHQKYNCLNGPELNHEYESMLQKNDITDTLIAICEQD